MKDEMYGRKTTDKKKGKGLRKRRGTKRSLKGKNIFTECRLGHCSVMERTWLLKIEDDLLRKTNGILIILFSFIFI